ncbi:Uncharacterized protein dnl_19740 [Desulfonema limicola]|uniref:Uncharacterized protein n=1 Tax=Desulfonema limicola TaxID=45656 RepID=A0A975B6H8_9BACT|nr:Os1348 family NHLP clan protein [Desulfonema limicola]QTA79698.1 Uncharacterized protein dnl_19740 [Desulfonema limicola]
MPQDSVEKFLGRLITDDDFRDQFKKNLARVCFEHGFDLTHAEQDIIQRLDPNHFVYLSNQIDKGIKRSRNSINNILKN